MRKSFSLSTRTAPAAVSHQSLPGVVQRRIVGWDSEKLTDSLQSKNGGLSEYIRIPYGPSESAHSGVYVSSNLQSEREATDTEDKGSDLSGTVQLCAKPATGQPCSQCQLSGDKIKIVFNKLRNAENYIQYLKSQQDHVGLGRLIINSIKEAGCNSWEWKDVEYIADSLHLTVEPEVKPEPQKLEGRSVAGYEVSFDAGSYKCAKELRDLVESQPFEGKFEATDKKTYYHVWGNPRTKEQVKPIWQIIPQDKKGEKKVKVKIIGLYTHDRNSTQIYTLIDGQGCSGAPRTIIIKS